MYACYNQGGKVGNNAVYADSRATAYGIYAYHNEGNQIFNNSYWIEGGSTVYAGYIYSTAEQYDIHLRNNVFYTPSQNGYGLYVYNSDFLTSDYNNVYAPNGTHFRRVTPSLSTNSLQDWRDNTGLEAHSLCYDPGFSGTGNLEPDPSNSASWSLNGRGVHIQGNDQDIQGKARALTRPDGVPDTGAYEFSPTSLPPAAAASGAPTSGGSTVYTLGQDTVALIDWDPMYTPPGTVTVRQYTGTQSPSFIAGNKPWFYTDISTSAPSAHNVHLYYQEPWTGNLAGESGFRLALKDGLNPWQTLMNPQSITDPDWNINSITAIPAFGWHSLSDVANNAATTDLIAPSSYFCRGTQTVKVQIKNNGNNNLNSVQIAWSIDGVFQSSQTYSSTIHTQGSSQGNEAEITLGNYNFSSTWAYVLKAWTYLPNGLTDPSNGDDTLTRVIHPGLDGTYTVGGTNPDFADVAAAIQAVSPFGVCGPTVFNIRDGNYSGGGHIAGIPGSSAINMVTFQSESGIAANVEISHNPASASDNYVVRLEGVSHIRFQRLKLVNTNTSNGRIFDIRGVSEDVKILHCILEGANTISSSNALNIIHAYTNVNGRDYEISHNTVTGGSAFIYLNGGASIAADSNEIQTMGYYGFYMYNSPGVRIRGNQKNHNGSGYCYAYYMNNCGIGSEQIAPEFIGKRLATTAYGYLCYAYNFHGTAANRAIIRDNILEGTTSIYYYYNYMGYQSSHLDIEHNRIRMISHATTSHVSYNYMGYYCQDARITNNEIVMQSPYGRGMYAYQANQCLVRNNTILMDMESSSESRGFDFSYISDDSIYNNTLYMRGGFP